MPLLHDRPVRQSIETRLRALRADVTPRWGKMAPDQMLWHVNRALAVAMGDVQVDSQRPPLPRPVMKFLVLKMPWPKNAPTNPAFVAKDRYDFEAERGRCLTLIEKFSQKPLDGVWQEHPFFGRMTGSELSQLQARHLDHHLTQFGV